MACISQPRDRLENRGGTDDKMFRRVWKEMENRKIDKVGVTEAEGERGKERRAQETDNRGRDCNSKNSGRKERKLDKVENSK